ncbi:MAG TPA: tRNA lysidine(34) synthetase TilS [Thermomicrobiales bacterium]|jgi:tRNA(Ile)-lysidine synthase|nr:tRNA lysidine(34) synthetase TilS [Thermomicrobiales bacterium]
MTRRRRPVAPRSGASRFEQRLLATWRDIETRLPPGPVTVGLSGGPDSLALLVALSALAPVLGRPIEALHVDHGIRIGSEQEAARAVAQATDLAVPIRAVRVPAGAIDAHSGVGPEEAARRERYRLAAEHCRGTGGPFLTAHHADDQAETVLLHLARGSGLSGVAGMAPVTELRVPWWASTEPALPTLTVVRPLLGMRKPELVAYLRARRPDLVPVHDSSNDDRRFRRNAIRADVLPALERAVPGATQAIARFARLATEDDAWLEDSAVTALASLGDLHDGLPVEPLKNIASPLRRRMIRAWLTAAGVEELSLDRTEAVVGLLTAEPGSRIEIGGNRSIVRKRAHLVVMHGEPEEPQGRHG